MDKDAIRWALHWPEEDVPDDVLAQYPDLKNVDRQIKLVTDSITIEGNTATMQGNLFDIRDFPMSDRIAQREFTRSSGLIVDDIEDVKFGRGQWELFHATEMVVIGIYKRLRGVLDANFNLYRGRDYQSLREGDVVKYGDVEVIVVCHSGAHLMKYYRDNESLKPILPSKYIAKLHSAKVEKYELGFSMNGEQLEMVF
jgi:hypothetical protein